MAVLKDGEILLYGFVGESFFDQGFTSVEVLDALAEIGRDTDVNVRINSGGGYVHEGFAIYNALAAHKGKVTVQIDSVAASSASLIAMAGETVTMRPGALMMIHDPSGFTAGTVDDHRKAVSQLERWAGSMSEIYADKSGKDVADVRATMKDELWMTAAEAVAEGYADAAEGKKAQAASAFDYRLYAHAPARLTALSAAKAWTAKPATGAAEPKPNSTTEEIASMATYDQAAFDAAVATARAEAVTADRARVSAILTNAAAVGNEALASHFAHETDMPADAAITALSKAAKPVAPTAAVVVTVADVADPVAAAEFAAARSGATALAAAAPAAATDPVSRILANYKAVTGHGTKA